MKAGLVISKTLKNKELNSSKLSTYEIDAIEFEHKLKKLEVLVLKLESQNEALIKRIDDLEVRHSRKFMKSNSLKSYSTLNSTLIESEVMEELTNAKFTGEYNEWKKDIEKSIQTISERVANNNSVVHISILEKRANDMNNEISKLKYAFDEIIDKTIIIKKNVDKYDRNDAKVSGLASDMIEIKSSNMKWQDECLKNFNELKEKIIQIQNDNNKQYSRLDKYVNLTIENSNLEFKNSLNSCKSKIDDIDSRFNEKIKKFDEVYKYLYDENLKINNLINEEISKIESSIKTLWDSFALLTSMVNNK